MLDLMGIWRILRPSWHFERFVIFLWHFLSSFCRVPACTTRLGIHCHWGVQVTWVVCLGHVHGNQVLFNSPQVQVHLQVCLRHFSRPASHYSPVKLPSPDIKASVPWPLNWEWSLTSCRSRDSRVSALIPYIVDWCCLSFALCSLTMSPVQCNFFPCSLLDGNLSFCKYCPNN